MTRCLVFAAVALFSASGAFSESPAPRPRFDAFDVAAIKQVEHDKRGARFITMQGDNRFVVKDYTLKLLVAAAYDLNPRAVIGGPAWVESEYYDITALTPGEVRPSRAEQMRMLRNLLSDRFRLAFHREQKEFSIYELDIARSGPKINISKSAPDAPAALISTVYPQRILLPARNATMDEFASVLQRAILDRPVVDKTGLTGRYDFDLEWAPDETQFGGEIPPPAADTPAAPLFTAIQQQLGLKLVATRGPIAALVVDKVQKPSEN
jgi:uncharacterized protein (TIGR03435 family)